jgi:hypothetical protein
VLAVFMTRPELTLFLVGCAYLTLGLTEGLLVLRREKELREERRQRRRQTRIQRKLERAKTKLAKREAKEKKSQGLIP